MALVLANRVLETTTTTGTGTITLGGTSTGFQSFSVIGDGNSTYYTITNGTDWEVGVGTYTASGTTLSRDTILASSNNGSAVNWGAGSKDVFVSLPASKTLFRLPPNVAVGESASATSSIGEVSVAVPNFNLEYFIVAGGGGGGGDEGGGGGGAGGYIAASMTFSLATSYTVTVGAGGTGGLTDNKGTSGSNSVFNTYTAVGGGAGGANGRSNVSDNDGSDGGSGGGGAPKGTTGVLTTNYGLGTTGQGNRGGGAYWRSGDYLNGGGGGGAGAVGGDSGTGASGAAGNPGSEAGSGGDGISSDITGSSTYYAGGGGGGGYSTRTFGGAGGLGGGGNGAGYPVRDGPNSAGTANTGGGGGGGGEATDSLNGANGGSGVVILKYSNAYALSNPGGGLTFSTSTAVSGYKVTTFTAGTGSISLS